MHLTNVAINKWAEGYEDCDEDEEEGESGHKRSLGAILEIIKKEGGDPVAMMEYLKDAIVKTMITGQPHLSHLYRVCQPECYDNSMCFQILGFDFLIDKYFKPYLLEVNCSPSFSTDSSLDYKIKKSVVSDAFKLLNFDYDKKQEWIKTNEEEIQQRVMTGKINKPSAYERERLKK